jgi:hypothetical protein
MKKSVLTPKGSGFFNSRNPFVHQGKPAAPRKEPFISNSTSPFRPRSTVQAKGSKENVENTQRKSVSVAKSPYKMVLNPMQTAKIKFQNELAVIFKEFLRSENQKNADPSKWR